ncbi:IS200/IS605 family transposase [Verrucomicrobiales bacterium BCK34]|nr:IS200/IS605 family transposase [Verrucomicrobiales bacterium BCK34]
MASTLTELLYHCIWSTKNREAVIDSSIEESVWKIIAGTASVNEMHVLKVGGIENHIHALVQVPKSMSISEAMKRLKGGSSKEINHSDILPTGKFEWQEGYAAFSVSKSSVPALSEYISMQREHHQKFSFEDEYVQFLQRHEVEYDPQSLWE